MSRPRVTVTKVLRLLLEDDKETWDLAKWAETIEWPDGVASKLKIAINIFRRAQFDNTVLNTFLDRVDGRLAPVYTLPDEDGKTEIVRPILYVAPERKEQADRLFRVLDVHGNEPKDEAPN